MPETKTHFAETRLYDAPPERSRSARRKALKRARKREASFGATRELELAGNGDADRDHPAADAGRFFVESKPERRASEKHFFLKALCLPANGALDPNGDLARHGGALAGWPEEKWVPHPSEDALRAAEASLSLAASAARKEHDFFSKNADANRPAPTTTTPGAQNARKIVFSDDDDDDDASDSSDAASDSEDEDATGADSDEDHSIETERAPPSAPLDPPRYDVRSDENVRRVTRAMLESLVAADHTLANQSLPIPGVVDPDDTGASLLPGDVVRYRYRVPDRALSHAFACSYFQGEVVSVAPDFGDAGGVRLAVTIAPWPDLRRTEALVCAARAAAEAETEKRRDGDRTVDPTSSLPACVATLGTRDVLEARLIGGPRYLVCKKPRHVAAGRGLDGEETAQAYAARGGVGGALAALRAGGSLEKR